MISKSRLDALTDGVFAVAMTLLVIDFRLPDSFDPKDATELLHRLLGLGQQAIVYAVSFYVLALRWIGLAQMAPREEHVSLEYARWMLINLLLITFVPFTTITLGRYVTLAPATWLYASNTILFTVVAMRMLQLAEERDEQHDARLEHRIGLFMLVAASVLAIGISLITPKWAMLAYLFNVLDGPLRWLRRRRRHRGI